MRRVSFVCFWILGLLCWPALSARSQDWRPLGPTGGDVRTLATDPHDTRLVYLGSSDGHIFGSRNGGERWERLGRAGSRADSIVTAILVDPRNSAVLYASTWTLGGEAGGVFGSKDGGRNWRPLGLQGQTVRGLSQAPSHPDILVAATLAGVFRSKDSGENWQQISPANHQELHNFDSVAIDPRNPDTIYAGTYHLAWKTTDGGKTWQPIHAGMIDDSDVMSIRILPTNPDQVYASACSGIYHSDNGAARWVKYQGIPPTARRTHLILPTPNDPQTIYAATTEGLWKTSNGGASWSRMTPANWSISTLAIHPQQPERLLLGVEGRGVYVSGDAGKTYRASNDGFYHRQVMDLAVDREHPERMLLVLANSADPAFATQDAGHTWNSLGTGLKPYAVRRAYAAPDGWWAALQGGGLTRYDQQKGVWATFGVITAGSAPAPPSAAKRGKRAPAKAPVRPAAVAKSARPFNVVVNDLAFTREQYFAATDQGLLVSRDRGANWMPLALPLPPKAPVHSVRASADGSHIWAISPRGLSLSRDAGKTWVAQDLGFDARGLLRFQQASETALVVSSGAGIYLSPDAGRSWHASNLPQPSLQDVAIAGDLLVVSTPQQGLYASADSGKTWAPLDAPASPASFPVIAVPGAASTVLAASPTEGLFTLELSPRSVAAAAARASAQRSARSSQR